MENLEKLFFEYNAFAMIISATLVFIVGILNLIALIRYNKKGTFINSVTEKRFKYINDFKSNVSAFCALASESSNLNSKEVTKLKYNILLFLNPEYKEWDGEIIRLVKEIYNEKDERKIETLIEHLILICQFNLKIEWAGAQIESKKGDITDIEKQELRNKNYEKYLQLKSKIKNSV